ncbi:PREDICTED: basic leucine zipper transcriptional factor ATF-like 2 isoform X2 [Dipodomys ordii]|uniref:Basic leucine zipper transcriptional factor ATF-like 2 n=1 Tax=Dipodomys ordii TaxID=10020 RepID=A0A1S3FIQ0_DIPOR|nr:PREDICTED: basic leucine zipper transcriptional factor ATF-like 2 isoform X2 [Dipodomys ordii]
MHLCGQDVLLSGTNQVECQRQLKKKQKNRVAAQRSRQKHTDKADALHEHESLEKHNHALRKEIHTLQAELTWWSRTLHLHERQCPLKCASTPTPLLTTCWGQAEQLQGQSAPERQHGCQEKPGSSPLDQNLCSNPLDQNLCSNPLDQNLCSNPLDQNLCSNPLDQQLCSNPLDQHLCSNPQGQDSPGLLPSPPPQPSLSPGPPIVTFPPAQLSPSPVLSALPPDSNFLVYCPKLSARLPSPPAQPASLQLLGLEHPIKGRPESSAHNPAVALGLTCPQSQVHKPELLLPGADGQRLEEDPDLHPLLAFPLLSSAQVQF